MFDTIFDSLLETLICQARKEKDDAHTMGAPLEVKRSLATSLTKLEEAQMWRNRAKHKHNKAIWIA